MLQSYALTGVCACARDSLDLRQAALRTGAGLQLTCAGRRIDHLAGGHVASGAVDAMNKVRGKLSDNGVDAAVVRFPK